MSQAYLLGIDLGTSAIKVGVFDTSGQVVALHQAPTPTVWDGSESAHHDADALWDTVAGLLRQVEPAQPIAAIGISSFGEAGTLVNPKGEAVVPVLAWFDPRPKSSFSQITGLMSASAWRERTGLLPDSNYSLCKLLWLKAHYPDAFRDARWLSVADWIAFKLTGSKQMGLTQASRTMALDLWAGRWLEEPLQELGLSGVLADLRSPGEAIGKVTAEAAGQTGLPAGIAVMETGHDQPMAAAGVGAQEAGTLVNSCGTAEVLFAVFEAQLAQALQTPGIAVGAYALKHKFYAMASLRASGAVWDWLVRVASGVHPTTHQQLLELARAVPLGSEGLRFLPHLRQQSDDPRQAQLPGGMFLGLHENHGLGHMTRSVIEGLSFEAWRLFQDIRQASGVHTPPIRAVGGTTQNHLWMQTKADLVQTPIETYQSPHAAAWGAAWLAGHHLGLVPPSQPQVQARFSPQAESPQTLIQSYQQTLADQLRLVEKP